MSGIQFFVLFFVVVVFSVYHIISKTRDKFRPSTIHVFTDRDTHSVKDSYISFSLNSVRVPFKRENSSGKNKHLINQVFPFLDHFEVIILRTFWIFNYLAFFLTR